MDKTNLTDSTGTKQHSFKVFLSLLNRQEKLKLIYVGALMLLGSVFEALSLGMVLPIIGLLSNPDKEISNSIFRNTFGTISYESFVLLAMLAMLAIFAIRTLFLIWKVWVQKGFSNALATRISRDLYSNYLRQPYSFFLTRNSSSLVRNSLSGSTFTEGFIDPFLFLISEGLVTFCLLMFLVVVEPIGTLLTLSIFGLGAFAYRKPTAKRISKWGEIDNENRAHLIQQVQQGFGGIKDVKMLRRESLFIHEFNNRLVSSASIFRRFTFLQLLPRYFLELLTMICFVVLVSAMILFGSGLNSVLPIIGLFGVAAFRILPATYQIIGNIQSIERNRPLLDYLSHDLGLAAEPLEISNRDSEKFVAVKISDLKFSYADTNSEALIGISLEITRGEAVGLVGQSGSGKSTLVDVLLGFLKPQEGSVTVNEVNIDSSMQWWRSKVGYVPQSIFLTDDTLRKNVAFGLPDEEIDENAVHSALRLAQLDEFVSSLPEGENTMVGERGVRLSGGQRQRIGIARALYNNPEVLVLDEATSSLDTETEHGVMQAVQALQGDKTVIIVAHRLSTVEYCDRLYRLDAGRIVDEGTFDEVMNRSQS